jgi:ribosome-associated protein
MVSAFPGDPRTYGSRDPGADLPVTPSVTIPGRELTWRFSHAGGPGGQGVNTTDSRVELTWDPATTTALTDPLRARALQRLAARLTDSGVTVTAAEFRSQLRNRRAARDRLAALIRDAIAPPAPSRRRRRPSAAARARRLDDKRRRSQLKHQRRRPPPTT